MWCRDAQAGASAGSVSAQGWELIGGPGGTPPDESASAVDSAYGWTRLPRFTTDTLALLENLPLALRAELNRAGDPRERAWASRWLLDAREIGLVDAEEVEKAVFSGHSLSQVMELGQQVESRLADTLKARLQAQVPPRQAELLNVLFVEVMGRHDHQAAYEQTIIAATLSEGFCYTVNLNEAPAPVARLVMAYLELLSRFIPMMTPNDLAGWIEEDQEEFHDECEMVVKAGGLEMSDTELEAYVKNNAGFYLDGAAADIRERLAEHQAWKACTGPAWRKVRTNGDLWTLAHRLRSRLRRWAAFAPSLYLHPWSRCVHEGIKSLLRRYPDKASHDRETRRLRGLFAHNREAGYEAPLAWGFILTTGAEDEIETIDGIYENMSATGEFPAEPVTLTGNEGQFWRWLDRFAWGVAEYLRIADCAERLS